MLYVTNYIYIFMILQTEMSWYTMQLIQLMEMGWNALQVYSIIL